MFDRQADAITDEDRRSVLNLALEVECPACGGTGYRPDRCAKCNGNGLVPTELGDAVLDLVRRRMKIGQF
jgi:hypothetical protein